MITKALARVKAVDARVSNAPVSVKFTDCATSLAYKASVVYV